MGYLDFLEGLPCPALLLDVDTWRPVVFNTRASDCLGYSRAEFQRLTITDFEAVPNPTETREHIGAIRRVRREEFPSIQRNKSGTPVRLHVRINVISYEGREVMLALWEQSPPRESNGVGPAPEARHWRCGRIVAESPAMRGALERAARLAATDLPVLIEGETGTGKDLVARMIHDASRRGRGVFLPLHGATIPPDLLDGELFGVERGAFTGADRRREGRFGAADKGKVFLDEVGELSLAAQVKLLRVLQDGEVHRLGAATPERVDVRVIAATNRDLAKMVARGEFRLDLYHRLAGAGLRVPALRERPEDIEPLVLHAISMWGDGRVKRSFAAADLARLRAWSWPGNVRELLRVVEVAIALSHDGALSLEMWNPQATHQPGAGGASLEDAIRRHVCEVLEACGWVIEGPSGAAALLGLRPSTLRSKMEKLGIRRPQGPDCA